MIAIDLNKHQSIDAGEKAIQQINFTGNLNQGLNVNVNMFSILKKQKKPL